MSNTRSIIKLLFIFCVFTVHTQTSNLDLEYSQTFTDLLELVYGENLLSQGGTESIDHMLRDQNLNGKKVLDIGSGLGGVDLYLAQKYAVDITGIDPVKRLVEKANKKKASRKLLGNVVFFHHEAEKFSYPYANGTFDIIFSKETFLHIADKKTLLIELFRILKSGGQLVIFDWLIPSHTLGPTIKTMMRIDNLDLQMTTLEEYQSYLKTAGFTEITASRLNDTYIKYTHENLEKMHTQKDFLTKQFSKEGYEQALNSWNLQKKAFEEAEVHATLLTCVKK